MTHFYEIRFEGHLDDRWQDWFDGMSITLEENGNTLLSGPVPDQPALYGILRRVRDLGLPLVSVNQIPVNLSQQSSNKKRSNTKMNTTQAVATGNRVSTTRIVGVVAVALAVSGFVQNAVFGGTGAPAYSDPLGVVLAYHAENRGAFAIISGLETVNMVLLLVFVTALHGLVQRRGGAGADWSRLALAAGAVCSTLFALFIATQIAVVVAASSLAEPNPAFALMWQLHAAVFALALPALGATFIGAALATHASGLIRPWQRLFGMVGGSLLILAGPANLAIAGGSPLIFVGVLGYFLWFIWLVVIGIRLIRGQG